MSTATQNRLGEITYSDEFYSLLTLALILVPISSFGRMETSTASLLAEPRRIKVRRRRRDL